MIIIKSGREGGGNHLDTCEVVLLRGVAVSASRRLGGVAGVGRDD